LEQDFSAHPHPFFAGETAICFSLTVSPFRMPIGCVVELSRVYSFTRKFPENLLFSDQLNHTQHLHTTAYLLGSCLQVLHVLVIVVLEPPVFLETGLCPDPVQTVGVVKASRTSIRIYNRN